MGSTAAASRGVRVSADVIIHATEDPEKILAPLGGLLGLAPEGAPATTTAAAATAAATASGGFATDRVTGCFENPIAVARAEVKGPAAVASVRRLVGALPRRQADELMGGLRERIVDSRLHLRLDKQQLVGGRVVMAGGASTSAPDAAEGDGGTVRITIRALVYGGGDAVKSFAEILGGGT